MSEPAVNQRSDVPENSRFERAAQAIAMSIEVEGPYAKPGRGFSRTFASIRRGISKEREASASILPVLKLSIDEKRS